MGRNRLRRGSCSDLDLAAIRRAAARLSATAILSWAVPIRIGFTQRIVEHIAVQIQALRVTQLCVRYRSTFADQSGLRNLPVALL